MFGGVADITNRGPLDRLLLSELAHDDLTLAARVALNEALYLRREPPMREPPGALGLLLDSGVRLWGIPRVLATAVALALIAVLGGVLLPGTAQADPVTTGTVTINGDSQDAVTQGKSYSYSTSKGAVVSMTQSVAKDYLPFNIRCNCICPARVHTPFVDGFVAKNYPEREQEVLKKLAEYQPIGRMGTPEEVAVLSLYLCSDEASFVTGAAYPIDGGVTAL